MLKTTLYTNYTGYQSLPLEIPNKCPHCSYYSEPISKAYSLEDFNKDKILTTIWRCRVEECKKHFLTTHIVKSPENIKFVNIYPNTKVEKFDKLIIDCSPTFVDLYNHAYEAQLDGNIRIAAVAYRMALEFLLKDYLIKYHSDYQLDINKIPTMKIINCLNYLEEHQQIAGDVVRILGNDYIHYQNKNENIDFENLKIYLDIFIHSILVQLRLKNPPVTRS